MIRIFTNSNFGIYGYFKNKLPLLAQQTILFSFFLFVLNLHSPAQTAPVPEYVDISRVQTSLPIHKFVSFQDYKRNTVQDQDIPSLKISQKIPDEFDTKLPVRLVEKEIYLKFYLYNSADSAETCYFFPGLYCRKISVFKASPDDISGSFKEVADNPEDQGHLTGYVLLRLMPGERAIFYVRLNFVLSSRDNLTPELIRGYFIRYFQNELLSSKITINVFNYVTAGILLMMLIYSFSVYFQDYQIEFLYYSAYAGCMAMLLFLKSYLYGSTSQFNYYFEGCLDFILQMIGYSCYLIFIRRFLTTKSDHPILDRFLYFCNWVILGSLVLFCLFYFVLDNYPLTNLEENISKQFLLFFSILFILYGIWKKDPLMNYIVAGQLFLTFFSSISFLLIITRYRFTADPDALINDPLLYYQIGMVCELVFFMSGLTYKNKRNLTDRVKERERLKLENERKEFEKQVAILEAKQQERNRISADMHDELGSGVTAIRLMSEIVKTKMKENTLPEIEKISQSANDLLGKMNTIIWTMVSSNDTVESLVAYLRAYAVEFFENTPIDCNFHFPSYIPFMELSGEKRRNIFLSVKEALNNVLKHSKASQVSITILANEKLIIEIADNGKGIDFDQLRKFGNGLQNMKKRIASISGEFRMENHQGTKTTFELAYD